MSAKINKLNSSPILLVWIFIFFSLDYFSEYSDTKLQQMQYTPDALVNNEMQGDETARPANCPFHFF